MALPNINYNPKMTGYLAREKAFAKNKLVVVDVGARYGGEQHWAAYGDQMALIGFEPDEAECKALNDKFSSKGHQYFPLALHRDKRERPFYVTEFDASSGFYQNDMAFWSRFDDSAGLHVKKTINMDTVDFDSFSEEQHIEHVDFMKLDVEGAELDILEGSRKYLNKGIMLGASIEVRFFESSRQPVFSEIDTFMRKIGFRLYDLEFYRRARAALPEAIDYTGMPTKKGQIVIADTLYLRDAVAEINALEKAKWDDTSVLKLTSLYEVFGLSDCAIELLQTAGKNSFLKDRDLPHLMNLLTPSFGGRDIPYDEYVKKIKSGEKPVVPTIKETIKNTLWKDLKLFGGRYLPVPVKRFLGKVIK